MLAERTASRNVLVLFYFIYFIYGASWAEDPHFTGLWGVNSGLGFSEPNNWRPGHFILHFAGQDAVTREANALRFTNTY